MIEKIEFTEILKIWSDYLWSARSSAIEPTSAMCYLGGFDTNNMYSHPTFFGYKVNGEIIGVNSGHRCIDNSYRSRGLYVNPKYRKQGIGKLLLESTILQAVQEKVDFIWSYPKHSSWKTYQSVGFILSSPWEMSELGHNAYCIKML